MMTNSGYLQFAEALVFAQGPKAEAEAARQAILCEKSAIWKLPKPGGMSSSP